MTGAEMDALALRVSNGFDYLQAQEYGGVEYRRAFPVYEGLCRQLRAELIRIGWMPRG